MVEAGSAWDVSLTTPLKFKCHDDYIDSVNNVPEECNCHGHLLVEDHLLSVPGVFHFCSTFDNLWLPYQLDPSPLAEEAREERGRGHQGTKCFPFLFYL